MSKEIILYDLQSKPPLRGFSGNAWKTRLVMNFKGIPYKTQWVQYIHLQDTLKATGLIPNPPGSFVPYSVPTLQFPDGSYLMDSAAIAIKLESMYPTPSLHLNPELEKEAEAAMGAVFFPVILSHLTTAVRDVIASEDEEWFKADRAQRFGTTVEDLMKEGDPDAAYAAAKPGFEKCREVLTVHKKDSGPFILGSVPSYADFYLVSTMCMFERLGEEPFKRFLDEAGSELRDLYKACESWTIRGD